MIWHAYFIQLRLPMSQKVLKIATRKSPLALWQAEHIKQRLNQLYPTMQVELVTMSTKGDKILDTPLAKIGGKGLFVKELEHSLLNKQADFAVHSMKDVPMEFPQGLELGVICERHNPFDAFVSNHFDSLDELPENAVVGTSSLRRQCQIMHHYPHLNVNWLRGNVQTRLNKLDEGNFDAIILAASGLKRLQLDARIKQILPASQCLPAGGQGALGIEWRCDDKQTQQLLAPLMHKTTQRCVLAERAMNRHLQGGCQVPIGAYCIEENGQLNLTGLVGRPDGTLCLFTHQQGALEDYQQLGIKAAEHLLAQGAGEILQAVYANA